jgi:hypothetical protein
MQHSHTSNLNFEGHHALWRATTYLLLAVAGLIAVIELSAGLLITLSIAAGLLFAFVERAKKLDAQTHSQVFPGRLLGDGGSFPNADPEMETTPSKPATVLDGGSLEHHRT